MKNINLNLGGLIGALICGGIVAIVVFSDIDQANKNGSTRMIIPALLGGAFAGNYLWEWAVKKRK